MLDGFGRFILIIQCLVEHAHINILFFIFPCNQCIFMCSYTDKDFRFFLC